MSSSAYIDSDDVKFTQSFAGKFRAYYRFLSVGVYYLKFIEIRTFFQRTLILLVSCDLLASILLQYVIL
jgi:hypothetical protein